MMKTINTSTTLTAPKTNAASGWLTVLLLLTIATVAGLLAFDYVTLTSLAMIYVLAVVIAAYQLDWVKSAVCAVFAATALNFFFVPPRWTFEIESPEHFIGLIAMLAVALAISTLAAKLRQETKLAHLNARRAQQLQLLASALADASTPVQVQNLGQQALTDAFIGPCSVLLTNAKNELFQNAEVSKLSQNVLDGLQGCMKEAAVLGPGTGRWPGLEAWYLPLGDKDQWMGAANIGSVKAQDDSGLEHAKAVCALLGQALWRQRLATTMLSAQHEAQRQQLQSTFLAAVSHDLRTPLAAIVGAASALQTQHDKLDGAEQERLLGSIMSEANYLSTLTENTLQMVRLNSTTQTLKRDWESIEEIVGSVLARVRERDPQRRIKSKVPHDLPLVKADSILLAQLISNLLDNALKYSQDAVELTVQANAQELSVTVKDRGPGIPATELDNIFKLYTRSDLTGQHGTGLGLALCQAIAQAHGGKLAYRPRAGGGSHFSLTLPIEAQPAGKESL